MSVQDNTGPNPGPNDKPKDRPATATAPAAGEPADNRTDSTPENQTGAQPEGRVLSLDERKARRQQQAARADAAGAADRPRKPIAVEEDDPPLRRKGAPPVVAPPVATARIKERHWGVIFSFLLLVIAPVAVSGWYLWTRAIDRYVSTAGFSVRTESVGSAFELLGGLATMGSSSSSDNDILYNFIQSQELVAKINAQIDLRALWAKADPAVDPVFAYHPPGTIEDMVDYWNRMVSVYNDSGTGLIELQVQAFTPEDAQMLAQAIYDESSDMINRLSAIAQADTTRFAREELDHSLDLLKDAREAVTRFRNINQIVDPAADMQSQMGLLSSLESELATTLIDLDILRQTTAESDPRIAQAERRAAVIEARMADERAKLGIGAATGADEGNAFADLVGEYERLMVDKEFAEQSYAVARSALEVSIAESRRQSRYLATHVHPTLAEQAQNPERLMIIALVALFAFLAWAMLVLMTYALKDRR